MNLYLIPGMGLDERLFFKLKLHATSVNYLNWLEPIGNESLQNYARRMATNITHAQNVVLVGVSFGGILAIEIEKIRPIEQVILISSIKSKSEKPFFFKVAAMMPFYRLSTPQLRYNFRKNWGYLFGLNDELAMDFFFDMFEKMSETYKDWAVRQIAIWRNESFPTNIVHLHGDRDLIFPTNLIEKPEIIKGGDHGMVVSRSVAISKRINQIVEELQNHSKTTSSGGGV